MAAPSLVALFDDYARKSKILIDSDCTKEFLTFVKSANQSRVQLRDECERLKMALDKSSSEVSAYERKLAAARSVHHDDIARIERVETERDELHDQLMQIRETLNAICRDGNKLANDTKQKLDKFINSTQVKFQTSTGEAYQNSYLHSIDEVNSTGDLLGDLSSSSDFDIADRSIRMKKPRRSDVPIDDVPAKRRRSSRLSSITKTHRNHVVAVTTVSVPPSGLIEATSKIHTGPRDCEVKDHAFVVPTAPPEPITTTTSDPTSSSDSENIPPGTPRNFPASSLTRKHDFVTRTTLRSLDECCVCLKSMGFGAKVSKCSDCKAEAHIGCREGVPMPCIPLTATPRVSRVLRLAELCGTTPPYVPPLVVRCALEVERRGLTEHGIYRVPGSEKDVRSLKALLLKLKGTVNLASYDIHVICGVLKDFFRNLPEPLITHALWQNFAGAVRGSHDQRIAALYQLVSELPAAHRDTLAYVVRHLLKVAESPQCMMNRTNLAIVFGPTLIGYSSANPSNQDMCSETPLQSMVVEGLLDLGEDYWQNILINRQTTVTPMRTPKFATRRNATVKSFRIFNSPAK